MDEFSTDEFLPVQPVYTEPYPVTDCSAVYTSPKFWSGQKLARPREYRVNERRIRARFCPFKKWVLTCVNEVLIKYLESISKFGLFWKDNRVQSMSIFL